MKILLIRSDMLCNGPGVTLFSIADLLKKNGHEVVILTGELHNKWKNSGFDIKIIDALSLKKRTFLSLCKLFVSLKDYIKEADKVICFNYSSAFLSLFFCFNKKEFPYLFLLGEGYEQILTAYPGKILSCSDYMCNKIFKRSGKKSDLVNLGLLGKEHYQALNSYEEKRKEIRELYEINKNDIVFSQLGSWCKIKNSDYTVELFNSVKKESEKRVFLIMQGDFCIEKTNFKKNLIGRNQSNERLSVLCASDFYIQASESETFGISVTEAMALKCVPFVSGNGALKERVKNGINGFVLSGNLREDTLLILNFIKQKRLQKKIQTTAYNQAWNKYRIDKTAKTFLKTTGTADCVKNKNFIV